ncbi:17496_t:CDS:2, partial [Racocetra persica]
EVETRHRRGSESSTSSVVRRMEKHSIQSQDLPKIIEEEISDVDDNEDSEGNCTIDQSIISLEKESCKRSSKDAPKNKLSSKKVKTKDRNISMLKKLIEELKLPSSSTSKRIESVNQEIIICYFAFGKKLKKRLAKFMKANKEYRSQRKLYEEVEKQLPSNFSKKLLRSAKDDGKG